MTYVFWNNGSPTPARVSGTGNRQSLRMPDGAVRMGRVRPDPAADLYEYAETGARPGRYQRDGGVSYVNDGWTVQATRAVVWNGVAEVRAARVSEVNAAAGRLLSESDWYVVRAVEEPGKPVPAAVATYRAAVRQATNDFELALAAEADPEAAAAMQPSWPTPPTV